MTPETHDRDLAAISQGMEPNAHWPLGCHTATSISTCTYGGRRCLRRVRRVQMAAYLHQPPETRARSRRLRARWRGPGEPFPSSIFRDKIRRDIGKSQSIWTDSKMETADSQRGAERRHQRASRRLLALRPGRARRGRGGLPHLPRRRHPPPPPPTSHQCPNQRPDGYRPWRNAPTDIGATVERWRRRGHSAHVVELVVGVRELHLDCHLLRAIYRFSGPALKIVGKSQPTQGSIGSPCLRGCTHCDPIAALPR
eukprot:COSAG01_NODE_1594_length_9789_cov_98.477399_12_plen_254_part_00